MARGLKERLSNAVGFFSLAFVVIALLFGVRDCFWTVGAELGSVDYFREPELVPGVIEAELECSPCLVERVDFDDNDIKVVMERPDSPGTMREYKIRKKTYVDHENVRWKKVDPQRRFDVRDVDFVKLKANLDDIRATTRGGTIATIGINHFYGPTEPLYVGVSLTTHEVRSFDAASGEPYKRSFQRPKAD